MNILPFLNSRDMAEHLKELNYNFSLRELAYIIWHNRSAPLGRKRMAWRKLCAICGDFELERHVLGDGIQRRPLSKIIDELLSEGNTLLQKFYDKGGAVYSFTLHCEGDQSWCEEHERLFPDYAACLDCIGNEYRGDYKIDKIIIKKRYIGDSAGAIGLKLNGDRQILGIYDNGVEGNDSSTPADWLDNIWVKFPTPFRRGDILQSPHCDKPFVLFDLSVWSGEELKAQGGVSDEKALVAADKFIEYHSRTGDGSDIFGKGWFFDENGNIYWDHVMSCYDFEYYRGGLTGINRCLAVLSSVLKGEGDVDFLLSACKTIVLQEQLKDSLCRLNCNYVRKFLSRFGLTEGGNDSK